MKKFLLIVLLVLVMTGIGVGTYFLGRNSIEVKDCEKKVETEDKDENLNNENLGNDEFYYVDYDEIEKVIESYSYLTAMNKSFNSVDEIEVDDLVHFAVRHIENRESYDYFTLDEVNTVLEKYFDFSLEDGKDIKCDVCDNNIFWYYDADSKRFSSKNDDSHAHEGSCYGDLTRIISITNDEENKYVVLTKKAFGCNPYVISTYYASLDEDGSEPVLEFYGDPLFTEAEFNNVPNDKLNTYEYVFELVDNRLVLKSFKKV